MRRTVLGTTIGLIAALLIVLPPARLQGAYIGGNGRIVYSSSLEGDRDIWVADRDGSNQKRLTSSPDWDFWPSWSPDGRRIAFTREGDIWVMLASGAFPDQLTGDSSGQHPTWSPDGNQIAFSSLRDGGDSDIWVMNFDGTDQRALTVNDVFDAGPAWSPDGRRIAFSRTAGGDMDIFVMDADGSHATNLTPGSAAADIGPAWSPDGRSIAFESEREDGDFIYVMDADGSDRHRVTRGESPAFAPGGGRIVFERGSPSDLFTIRPDGTGRVRLTTDARAIHPDWQPRCTITGTAGDDDLAGTDGNDLICPLGGDDTVSAGGGDDVVFGNYGDDTLNGGAGRDVLVGGWGEDTLRGNRDADRLIAGTGEVFPAQVDSLAGGGGNDWLDVRDEGGDDTASGGDGTDVCLADPGDTVTGCP